MLVLPCFFNYNQIKLTHFMKHFFTFSRASILTLLMLPCFSHAQYVLNYHGDAGVNGGQTATTTLTAPSTCQVSVTLDGYSGIYNGVSWNNNNFNLTVNGSSIGSYSGAATIDLTAYIPVTSVTLSSTVGTW